MTLKQALATLAALLLLCLSRPAQGQTATSVPRLVGIVDLPPAAQALLEVQSGPGQELSWSLLQAGQRERDVRVLAVHPERGTVELNLRPARGSTTVTFTNQAYRTSLGSHGLALENASLEQVFRLYGELSRRTLLCWPRLPKLSFSLRAAATNDAQAAAILQTAITEKGLAAIVDGTNFTMILPQGQAAAVSPRAAQLKIEKPGEIIPAGVINFPNTDISQVSAIYAELLGRKLDRSMPMPRTRSSTIRLRTETALTREEVVYALDTVFAWAGVKMLREGNNLIKPVAILWPGR